MNNHGEQIAFTVILAGSAAVFLAEAWGLESGSRLGPVLLAAGVLGLLLFQLGRDVKMPPQPMSKLQPDEKVALSWVLGLLTGIWLVGCVAAIGLQALLYVRYRGRRSWAMAAAWGCLGASPVYAVSVWMLRPELRMGALFSW